jgi:hypothetical protein
MSLGGFIFDAGGYKKWVDEWRCLVHGPPKPPEPDKSP